jgi:hypothetical protein
MLALLDARMYISSIRYGLFAPRTLTYLLKPLVSG